MKYAPKLYAQAFAAAAAGELSAAEEKKIVSNFLGLIEKNGDLAQLPKILEAADRELRRQTGRREVKVSSARTLTPELRRMVDPLLRTADVVREETDPALVAGVRITIENELQFDGTLKRKLEKLIVD